ncbi:ABC transporter ATP-binding protein [Enterococcus villorum]|uniref:ABC-type quaternary amine transporter n=2 Tax=Enterococcus villorum TaxID=112904 RepID=A0A511J271_9ENTE|nr:ABC transporter ATP-binding protein [Enterococcus villorum]EOH89585.1 ABC transporter ATP-binding protein [Enterococcus villorum ATCC 700913]EOW78257.1 ABC transporter ATP-binding protein [Enterococcus villorum ATCC 700913]GEL92105.1 proline/glycine betaine ABC transporter ATP-binding protein [Enterococcus villorum]
MNRLIEFKQIQKKYGEKYAIKELSLSIDEGEIFVLVGPSGSGKTTSLKMINGLSQPSVGEIFFKGKSLKEYNLQKMRWQMGYVLQQIALFPTMSVKQNIEVIPEMIGWERKKREQVVDQLLEKVGLDPKIYRNRMPQELSGGEQQRIGILRALAASPEVILMDEPFSALDPLSRSSLQDLVLSLHQELGTTIVFVTHNMDEAIKLGDRIAVMKDGELIQCDTPEQLLASPKNNFVRSFFDETIQQKQQTVKDLVLAKCYSQNQHHSNQPFVYLSTPLNEVYKLLSQHEIITIQENNEWIGEVTRKDILTYLSRKERENEKI